ncbi:unnamed protein product [Oikopleura dioica]|uniref:Uncharacterized protein n=1 Tax=Oikopleura dioica TaxID=34765 RepID=E4Z6Z5_OIKDI|nr:unnamed protein product [Oikopleura dioica]
MRRAQYFLLGCPQLPESPPQEEEINIEKCSPVQQQPPSKSLKKQRESSSKSWKSFPPRSPLLRTRSRSPLATSSLPESTLRSIRLKCQGDGHSKRRTRTLPPQPNYAAIPQNRAQMYELFLEHVRRGHFAVSVLTNEGREFRTSGKGNYLLGGKKK